MKRAPIAEGNPDHRLLRSSGSLADRLRDLAGLAMAEASAALAVADHHERCEAEALAALHGLRNAVDVDELLDELLAAFLVVAASTTVVATATTASAVTAATAASAATAAARSAGLRLPDDSSIGRQFGLRLLGAFLSDFRRFSLLYHLELQSAFAGSVGEGLYTAMEEEAAAVEHDLRDAGVLGALGERLADGGSAVLGGARRALEVLVEGRRGSDGLAGRIVDDLGVDVTAGAVDRQARLAGRAATKRGANAAAAAVEEREIRHGYFFLPSLRKMYSPRYLMPLPLYGSGLRQRRISAATCPTFWRSMPLISTVFWSGVLTSMPSGTGKFTSWL